LIKGKNARRIFIREQRRTYKMVGCRLRQEDRRAALEKVRREVGAGEGASGINGVAPFVFCKGCRRLKSFDLRHYVLPATPECHHPFS